MPGGGGVQAAMTRLKQPPSKAPQRYADRAEALYAQGLGLPSQQGFLIRDDLKAAGWFFYAPRGAWCAPDAQELARIQDRLRATPLPLAPLSVTVHADAGWKEGRARVGYLLRASLAPYKIEHVQDGTLPSSFAAEALALRLGVERALGVWPTAQRLYLRTDCLPCLDALRSGHPKNSDLADILRLTGGVVLDLKHVRGHGPITSTAAWANSRVDAMVNLRKNG